MVITSEISISSEHITAGVRLRSNAAVLEKAKNEIHIKNTFIMHKIFLIVPSNLTFRLVTMWSRKGIATLRLKYSFGV